MRLTLPDTDRFLSRTPGVLGALVRGLGKEWTHADYGSGTWSAAEVVAHLIHAERTDWIPRARIILEHGDSRPFDAFDRNGHATLMRHSLDELLDLFARERAASLAELRRLVTSEADLDRPGTHPALGRVTLRNLLATWTVHDLNHIAQMCKAMAYQCKGEVGAWEAYLSILSPPNPR